MTTISLYVDTQDHTPIKGGNKPFSALRYLDIGLSPLNSPTAEVAAFLSGILLEGCKLDWHGEDSAIAANYSSWASVANLLPTLIKIRKAEHDVISESGGASKDGVKDGMLARPENKVATEGPYG
ncbi:hypothetical protein EYR36_004966 [Pleurotus pulmonarius]|nr:hypothetical protein EYR36_004966 [Pleurotus pulmonarius]